MSYCLDHDKRVSCPKCEAGPANHIVKFWMVWNPGNRAPLVKHVTFDSAYNEARRLAVQQPAQEFIVLQSCGTIKVRAVTWEEHE